MARRLLRLCDTCPGEGFEYGLPDDVLPEMECVWQWFDAHLGDGHIRYNPRRFCDF